MGLDMYLDTSTGEELGYWRKANQIHNWFVENVQNGVDDQNSYVVSKEQLLELQSICREVKDSIQLVNGVIPNGTSYDVKNNRAFEHYCEAKVVKDISVCEELLPTRAGFFFGGTAYDEYYVEDIDTTLDILDHVFKTVDFDNCDVLYSCWW